MIAIVTKYGDFDVAITFEELDNWSIKAPIEGELLRVGEVPCGKKIRLILEPNAEELVSYHLDGEDWDRAKKVELVYNQKALDRLNAAGKIYAELTYINVLLQASNALGTPHEAQ